MAEDIIPIEQIEEQLTFYTQASNGRTIEFLHTIDTDEMDRIRLYLQAKMTGKDYIVSKTIIITETGLFGETLEYLAIGLRRMLEMADDEAQIGGLGALLPMEEPEE